MFEFLFKRPCTVARHSNGPMAEERRTFLAHLAVQGTSLEMLRTTAARIFATARVTSKLPGRLISVKEIQDFARSWSQRRKDKGAGARLLWTARKWLRFLGRLEEPSPPVPPFANLLDDFAEALRQRELSPRTVFGQRFAVSLFLRWFNSKNRSFASITFGDVDEFLAEKRNGAWCRRTIIARAQVLKSFFRHAGKRGWCAPEVAECIDPPTLYRFETLPLGPTWEQVQMLIESTDTAKPADVRARAMILLLAVYGLRAGEVESLRLDDLDWDRGVISIFRRKSSKRQQYPLAGVVGDAIIRYLREVRPRSSHRQLFLTLSAPVHPVTPRSLYSAVSRRFTKLRIAVPHRGPHALRHACATRLLSEGFSIEEIGRHLGHRSVDATQIYAKVDLAGLRDVARFDLGGLL